MEIRIADVCRVWCRVASKRNAKLLRTTMLDAPISISDPSNAQYKHIPKQATTNDSSEAMGLKLSRQSLVVVTHNTSEVSPKQVLILPKQVLALGQRNENE